MGGAAAASSNPNAATPLSLQLLAFSVFAIGNIGLNYFNSWALKAPVPEEASGEPIPGIGKGGFQFPFFYTMFHMAASALAALVLQMTCAKPKDGSLPSFSQLWMYKWQLIPIAFLTMLNNGFNNMSLGMVALYVNQVIKACAPLPTSFFEWIFMGKTYNLAIYTTCLVLVAGCIVSNAAAFLKGGDSSTQGILICLISLLASTIKPVVAKMAMSGGSSLNPCGGSCGTCLHPKKDGANAGAGLPPLSPSQVMFWDTGLAFWMFLVIWLCDEKERQGSIEYLTNQLGNPNGTWLGLGIIVFGSFLAFIFNIANYYFIQLTTALTATIGANGVKIFLIFISALTAEVMPPALTWVGIMIVVVSIAVYAYLSFQLGAAARKAAAAKIADEKTPLQQPLVRP